MNWQGKRRKLAADRRLLRDRRSYEFVMKLIPPIDKRAILVVEKGLDGETQPDAR